MDMSGISWGNLITLLGIIIAFYFSIQSNKRASAEAERQVLALHTQNVKEMAEVKATLKMMYEWMRDEMRSRRGSGSHPAVED